MNVAHGSLVPFCWWYPSWVGAGGVCALVCARQAEKLERMAKGKRSKKSGPLDVDTAGEDKFYAAVCVRGLRGSRVAAFALGSTQCDAAEGPALVLLLSLALVGVAVVAAVVVLRG